MVFSFKLGLFQHITGVVEEWAVQVRDESGSRVNGSLGQAIQNLSMSQLGPGSNIIFKRFN